MRRGGLLIPSAANAIVACVNVAAGVPGHIDLPISQIVTACMASSAGDPFCTGWTSFFGADEQEGQ